MPVTLAFCAFWIFWNCLKVIAYFPRMKLVAQQVLEKVVGRDLVAEVDVVVVVVLHIEVSSFLLRFSLSLNLNQ